MSSITGLISGGGGGNPHDPNLTLDFFPAIPILSRYTRSSISTSTDDQDLIFWTGNTDSLSDYPQGFVGTKTTSGWSTLLNVTGYGELYWVLTPAIIGEIRLKITADDVAKEWSFTHNGTSGDPMRVFAGLDFGMYAGTPANAFGNRIYSTYYSTFYDIGPNYPVVSTGLNTVGFNVFGYRNSNAPYLKYTSSLKVEIYTSVPPSTTSQRHYMGALVAHNL